MSSKKLLAYIKENYFDSFEGEWEELIAEFERYG